jgi:localization factor PodJL
MDMAGRTDVKAGRVTNGDLNLDKAREQRGSLEQALEELPENRLLPQTLPPFSAPAPQRYGRDGDADADAQLNGFLERAKAPKQAGFPPLEALSARLNEFTAPIDHAEIFETEQVRPVEASQPAPSDPRRPTDLDWFEERFSELKSLLGRRESDKNEILSINAKLAEIINRVDLLSAAMPGEKAMAAVESQLAEVARALHATRTQSSSDASRIARAAQEILVATERAEAARAGFENAARHTVKELGKTVVVAASRAAAVTAEQIAAALHQSSNGGFARVENELRELNASSREASERTAAALERVHQTLRLFLEKGVAEGASAATPRKRAGVHTPITANAPAYTRSDANFGAEPAPRPRLDTITLRKPPPPDPQLIDVLKQAEERLNGTKNPASSKDGGDKSRASAQALRNGPLFRDEDKALPLFGLGIVAVVLLIASAALFYLHTKSHLPPLHLSVLPDVGVAAIAPASGSLDRQPVEDGPPKLLTGAPAPKGGPALFTAADQNPEASASGKQTLEDLQAMTSAASRGDRDAQFRIAARFLNGGPSQGDPASAARWLARAAEQGHTESQFVLASLYERGTGVPKDEEQARDLYRKAASAGHIRAMHNLGVLLSAEDTTQDYQEAAGWFASAAMGGLTDSQFNLALLYERGLGLQQSNQKAYFWYQVASLAGDKEAARRADQLKRLLPEAETQAMAEKAGSWRPTVEQFNRVVSGSNG